MQKPQMSKNIDEFHDKLQEYQKYLQSKTAKNRMAFPMHEQSISNFKTEAIT